MSLPPSSGRWRTPSAQPMTWRRVLFRVHWSIGIVAGLVLAFVAATGSLLAFKDEILVALDTTPAVTPDTPWPAPDLLLATLKTQRTDAQAQALTWSRAPFAVEARLTPKPEQKPETVRFSADGATLIEPARGRAFFDTVEGLHRSLAAGEVGKRIIGISVLGLMFLATSGLWMRFPRTLEQLRRLLFPNLRARGRALLWQLHSASGAWLCALYLLTAATGLFWSFEWSRGLWFVAAGIPAPPPRPQGGPPPAAPPIAHDLPFASAMQALGSPQRVMVGLVADPAKPIEFRYLSADAAHERAFGLVRVGADGAIQAHEPFAEQPRGRRLIGAVLPLAGSGSAGASCSCLRRCACRCLRSPGCGCGGRAGNWKRGALQFMCKPTRRSALENNPSRSVRAQRRPTIIA